ncbi:MAG TPA: GNAT family N-acetyltransferase [Vitreimonas sp.]|nr:GNAT family N-acetyltransferase [Vitreimonas sp.]
MIPIIETERLILRGHMLEDFEASAAMWAEPAVTRFIGGKPSTREESWQRMTRYPGHWALMGYGFWVLEEKTSKRFVGEAGFGQFKRTVEPPLGAPEQGWAMASWAHGKGYASEAIAAQIKWAAAHFGRVPLFCMISPENGPSIRVAEKHGYREFARTTYKGEPTILFRREPA